MRSSRPEWARNRSDDSESGGCSGVGEATRVGMRNPRVERDEVFPHHPEGCLGYTNSRRSAGGKMAAWQKAQVASSWTGVGSD